MSSSTKFTYKRDFAAGVYLSEAQNPIYVPWHTVYVFTVQYTHTWKGGGEIEAKRRLEEQ